MLDIGPDAAGVLFIMVREGVDPVRSLEQKIINWNVSGRDIAHDLV